MIPSGSGTLDTLQSGTAVNQASTTGKGAVAAVKPGEWTKTHSPSATTKATVTKAGVGSSRHVVTGITATVACDSAAQSPLTVSLSDNGTVIWSITVSAPVNGMGGVCETGFAIICGVGTDVKLEFSGAGVTGSLESVTLTGFTTT